MDLSTISNLGVAGFSVLVMWWMFKSAQDARFSNDQRLDKRDEAMRTLEYDIRNRFSSQLQENTNAMIEHTKIMHVVLDLLRTFQNK